MNTKDSKKLERVKIDNLIAMLLILVFAFITVMIYVKINKNSYASVSDVDSDLGVKLSTNNEKIDLDEIIKKNTVTHVTEELKVEEVELEYITKYQNNSELPKGMIQILQEGRNGTQEIIIKTTYENGEIKEEKQVGSKVTKASVNKIVQVGTASYTSNYKVKVGDKLFVTAYSLAVRIEPDDTSRKIITIQKDEEVQLLEILDGYYKIKTGEYTGYVQSDCLTYIDPNAKYEDTSSSGNALSKAELNSRLSFDMALNKPSGLTLEQFKKVLKDSNDKNKIFEENAEYFYYIEKQYNINGIFVAAVGIHESNWGTSKISLDKKNLFGYGAYDRSPYESSYDYSDYSESIDLIARVFVKYYINPAGMAIYDNQQASGKYYNGSTLSGVNVKYASDKNWANSVYKCMKYLYNKI